MEKLEGLDEEIREEKQEKVMDINQVKRNRRPFHVWTVNGQDYKLKLKTSMVTKLENKYRSNILNLMLANDTPPLSVMLTVIQAAMSPWRHGTSYDDVVKVYDDWMDEGGNQLDLYSDVILPTLAVSGFFTDKQAESLMKNLEEVDLLQ